MCLWLGCLVSFLSRLVAALPFCWVVSLIPFFPFSFWVWGGLCGFPARLSPSHRTQMHGNVVPLLLVIVMIIALEAALNRHQQVYISLSQNSAKRK